MASMTEHVPTDAEIAAMTKIAHTVYENRVRRVAGRQLLTLHKTRRRDPRAFDYGTYRLAGAGGETVVTGTLPEMHSYLIRGRTGA
jgi:hypothetical protein